MKFTIRRCSKRVANGIWRIVAPLDSPIKARAYWAVYDKNNNDCPVGFAAILGIHENDKSVFFSAAGVLPEYSGMGLQRKLIIKRLRWAKKKGYLEAETYTTLKNYSSIINLLRCGFRFETPASMWVGEDIHYFRKRL